MTTLNMNGPYKMDTNTIDAKVTRTSPGNYALGKKDNSGIFLVGYVGRSDTDVGNRLKSWIKNTTRPLFKFSYAISPKVAFEKECTNYHDFNPTGNGVHPQRPDNMYWKCPKCKNFG